MSDLNVCKRCNNSVVTGHKCRQCGVISHKSCLKTIKAKFYDDSTVDCCHNQTAPMKSSNEVATNITIDIDKTVEQIRITYLEEIVRQKDLIINNQAMLIESLQAQISLLNREVSSKAAIFTSSNNSSSYSKVTSNNKNLSEKNDQENGQKQNKKQGTSQSAAPVISAVHSATTSRLAQDSMNLANDKPPTTRRNTRNLLIGNAVDVEENSCFKSAKYVRMKHLHVTNCDPGTTQEALSSYLKEIVPSAQVEGLISRNPSQYSSFKISLPSLDAHKILKPELWPNGVVVNQFFLSRKQSKDSEKDK